MTTIRCHIVAKVVGTDPPANDPGDWVREESAERLPQLRDMGDRSLWSLRGESLLHEGALLHGAEVIVRNAFGDERMVSASYRRLDGKPNEGAAEKARDFLAERGLLEATERNLP